MTIFVDPIQTHESGEWCHMWSDPPNPDELHAFAAKIGCNRAWAQVSKGNKYNPDWLHYDLRPSKCALAIKHGAVEKTLMEFLREQKAKWVAVQPGRTCPYKRDEKHDCLGRWVGSGIAATAICNMLHKGDEWDDPRSRETREGGCSRWYREAALADIAPEKFCCAEMEQLFHECAEADGYMAGGFDLRKYPNDSKDVWRNYERIKFRFCPFCASSLIKDIEVTND